PAPVPVLAPSSPAALGLGPGRRLPLRSPAVRWRRAAPPSGLCHAYANANPRCACCLPFVIASGEGAKSIIKASRNAAREPSPRCKCADAVRSAPSSWPLSRRHEQSVILTTALGIGVKPFEEAARWGE